MEGGSVDLDAVFDVLPANLRRLHAYTEAATFGASLALNAALAALLLTERSRELRDYSRVLLVNCAVDVLFTFACFVTQMEVEAVDRRQIFILNGPLASADIVWQYAALFAWTTALGASLACIPLVFVFRFFIFVRARVMRNSQIFALVCVAFVYGLHQAVTYVAAVARGDPDRSTVCPSALNYTIWASGRVDNCLASKRNSANLLYAAGSATVMNVVMYATMIYCTIAVFQTMKNTRQNMSAKTIKLHRQMNNMLFIQMCLPLFTAVIPVAFAATFPYLLHVYVPGIGILIATAFSSIPLVSPLTTILFVSNFRNKLFRPLRRVVPRGMRSLFHSTSTPSQQLHHTHTSAPQAQSNAPSAPSAEPYAPPIL